MPPRITKNAFILQKTAKKKKKKEKEFKQKTPLDIAEQSDAQYNGHLKTFLCVQC